MSEETFYTIPEAAAKLRVTRAAIYKWMKQGRLEYVMVGSERRVTGSAIAAFVRSSGDNQGIDTHSRSGVQSDYIRTPMKASLVTV